MQHKKHFQLIPFGFIRLNMYIHSTLTIKLTKKLTQLKPNKYDVIYLFITHIKKAKRGSNNK